MTLFQFVSECTKRYIDPDIALDNEKIVEALKARDDKTVVRLLDEEL